MKGRDKRRAAKKRKEKLPWKKKAADETVRKIAEKVEKMRIFEAPPGLFPLS